MSSHCVVAALGEPLSETTLRGRVGVLAGRFPVVADAAVFAETFPYEAADARAERLRNRLSTARAHLAGTPAVRFGLLSFRDRAELVVVACGSVLDEASAHAIVAMVAGDLGADAVWDAPAVTPAVMAVRDAAADGEPHARIDLTWCSSAARDRGAIAALSILLTADAARVRALSEAQLLAALAHAARRRVGFGKVPVVVRRHQRADGRVRLGNFDVLELVGVPALPEQSYDEALESVQAALDDGSPLAAGVHDLELRLAARWEREPPHVVARRAAPAATFAFALRGTPDASVVCEYREDAADADAAKDLLADFARAIEIQARSDTPPAPAAWFSPGGESAPSRRDVSAVPCAIHDLVAKQTALRPDARAVSGTSGSFTYRALDAAADEIAGALQDAGVGRGDRVGVCVSRDIGLVAALLGVLKSGAAYVPLDGSYPQERLDYMAADAALSVVVAAPSLAVRFAGKLVIAVDERGNCERGAVARAPARRPHAEPSDAAYVIYTSGSTGVPKGVVVEHRNFSALLAATRDEFALSDTDVWTCFHSCAFDFSVWEIWACLATGGELVVVTDGAAREPQEFRELLRERRVTVLNQTPSAFSNLLAAEREHAPDLALRLVIFGGEPLDARILLPWFDRYPEDRCRVVNMFGITETTVHCTHVTLTRPEALAGSRSVGVPLPGWQIYVLDPMGVPLPAGVAGEIYVGGGGVARGYLGKPGLTAQRFRPDNVANSGHRLYRSGDKGRMRRDGQLEHLGRLDGQVKVRGYRIELDEIRHRLLESPGVRAACVVLHHRGESNDAHIDAYVVGECCEVPAVRERLSQVLPGYMLPSTITVLGGLPLTSNGKLDAKRLPSPAAAPPSAVSVEHDRVDASLESLILALWKELLGNPVALDDNFFLVGGNSLLALRVSSRLKELGFQGMSARTLYANPTAKRLSGVLAQLPRAHAERVLEAAR